MKPKNVINIAGLAVAVGCAVVGMMAIKRHQAALTDARLQSRPEQSAQMLNNKLAPSAARLNPPAQESVNPHVFEAPTTRTKESNAAQSIQPPRGSPDGTPLQMPAEQQTRPQKLLAKDPLAREALSFVGEDLAATAYWATAINDPSLPDEERKDLIEDLNEDGLSDAKHPGPEDLPLILSRIELIEALAPYALDQVNADAFEEAYKDLLNMLNGQPVQ